MSIHIFKVILRCKYSQKASVIIFFKCFKIALSITVFHSFYHSYWIIWHTKNLVTLCNYCIKPSYLLLWTVWSMLKVCMTNGTVRYLCALIHAFLTCFFFILLKRTQITFIFCYKKSWDQINLSKFLNSISS